MKIKLLTLCTLFVVAAAGQDKTNYVAYNKLTELQGSNYVIASVENRSKLSTHSRYLLFINTTTGSSNQLDFPKDSYIEKVEQIKLDSLNINKVIISAKTVNLDDNKSIDWNDPMQIIVCSTDGTGKTQVTEDNFFVIHWMINRQTGAIVITGYVDSNNNKKLDKGDKNKIVLYDLKTMNLIKEL